jgi:Flp pilus assembly protein TadD
MSDSRVPAFVVVAVLAAGLLTGCDPDGDTAPRGVPEPAIEQNNLGTAYLGQQNWADAETAFLAALELRPDEPLLLNNIAVARIQQGRIDEAVEVLRQALAADPDHLESHYNLGLVDKNQGDFESAAAHFEQVALQDGDDLDTQYNLGVVLSRLGRDDEAETAFRKALARNPTHVSTLYGLGRFLMQHEQVEEGEAMITRSQEIRASGIGDVVGTQYGEQGPYALGVDYPAGALTAPADADVSFGAAIRSTTLQTPAERAWTLSRGASGAALWLADDGTVADHALDGTTTPAADGTPGRIHAVAAGDADNDGVPETAVLASKDGKLFLALAKGGEWSTAHFEPSVLANAPISADLTFVDRDHDGDIDLFACWMGSDGTGCAFATNDAAANFAVSPSTEHGFSPPDGSAPVTVAFSDYDNDRDVDLILALAEGVQVLTNFRDGT